jgi:hypothetical protein
VRQPLTAFDALAQANLKPEVAQSASRLFHDGEFDDIPTSNLLRSMGLEEESK